MSDDTITRWTPDDDARLEELRRERRPKDVKAAVERAREAAQRTRTPRDVPAWGREAVREQLEEQEVMRAYDSADEDCRAWLDDHVRARLSNKKPAAQALWWDRTLRDVLLAWKRGDLDDDRAEVAEPLDHHDKDEAASA